MIIDRRRVDGWVGINTATLTLRPCDWDRRGKKWMSPKNWTTSNPVKDRMKQDLDIFSRSFMQR